MRPGLTDLPSIARQVTAMGPFFAVVSAMVTAVFLPWPYVRKILGSALRWLWGRLPRFDTLPRMDRRLEAMAKQLGPDGGETLYDKMTRMEERQALTAAISRATFRWQSGLAWVSLPNGDQVEATDDLLRISGRSAEEMAGRGWESTIHPEDRKRVVDGYLAALAMGIHFDDHARFIALVGRTRYVEIPARIVAAPANLGRPTAYIGRLFPDISEDEVRALIMTAEMDEAKWERPRAKPPARQRKAPRKKPAVKKPAS